MKKLFLFDIDGTLSVGDTLFPGSRKLLEYIEEIGGKSIYITNNSTRSGSDYVERFRQTFDLDTEEWQFITAGYLTILYLREHYADKKIFALGTKSFVTELRSQGFLITTEVEADVSCVLVGFDNELRYEKLEKACELLAREGVDFLATNPDLCCPAPFGFIPDCGSICQMLENSTGRKPRYLGKPSAKVVECCLQKTGFKKKETLVIGDRLYTDIACGIEGGVETCLVFTGEAKKEDVATTPYRPDYCLENVEELLQKLKEKRIL